jgi:hypothetical protein
MLSDHSPDKVFTHIIREVASRVACACCGWTQRERPGPWFALVYEVSCVKQLTLSWQCLL